MGALVIDVRGDAVCCGIVPSIVVLGRMVLNILWVEADETISGPVGVLSISEVSVMVVGDSPGSGVAKEV